MAGSVPTLYWFDRWDERIGLLRVVGELVHTEELNDEDTLEFCSYDVPSKGDRLLWLDNGTWREHVVPRLVGGTDGFVPSQTSGASMCKLGAGGVLTDPNNDARTWFWAHYYADGEGVLTATSTPDATRELVVSGRICAIGKYVGLGFTPWDGMTEPTHRQYLTSATFAADMATFTYLNLNYLFYSCTNLASVSGLGNLSGVRSMRYTFSSCAFTTIDFRGFDPSTLTDLFYTFSGCSHLTTIYADATWALPSSGITGSQCFYSCGSLVGGNGTAWASSKTAYTYFRIDTASTPGYLTAA